MKKLTFLRPLRWVIALAVMPAVVYACAVSDRAYYLSSLLVIAMTLAVFFLSFERRAPQARELALLAVMCALAVAARVIIPLPSFKPTMALVILAGMAFGAERGFLCGSITALVSNFFFSQGPWTPWQMMGYGIGGLLAGLLCRAGVLKRRPRTGADVLVLAAFGFLLIVAVVGPILDTSTYLTVVMKSSGPTAAGAIYLTGLLTANLPHGAATAAALALVGRPMLAMLERIQTKYDLLQN